MNTQEQWKNEIDDFPVQFFGGESFIMQSMAKSFISSLLAAQRAEMVKKAKAMKQPEDPHSPYWKLGFERARSMFLALLSGEGK